MRDVLSAAERPERGEDEAAAMRVAQADAPPAPEAGNTPPEAENLCIVTAEDATLSFSVAASDADGDPLTVTASQPESGRVEVGPDGTTLTFVADEPGLQSFAYAVQDGRGGSDSANATVFANPIEEALTPPVMTRVAPADLPAIAQACAAGIALETTPLRGADIQIQDPTPGQRFQIQAETGQRIQLQSQDFVEATYLVVDGGLLIVTPDGNMAYVADFVANARGDDPLTLSVFEGPAVPADVLLASLQPIAFTSVGQLVPPAAGSEHGGGANFSPYDPGNIGTGPDPLGPLLPTALGLGTPPVLLDTGVNGAGDDNQPPTITLGPQVVPVGEVTVTPEFTSGRAFPQLVERQALDDARINGIDQGNFTLGPSADARITFIDEAAQFENTLGVYLIEADGTIRSPKIVFPRIEHAEADPNEPVVRPGGGPLQPGDAVLLSQLYDPGELQEGHEFGLFLITEGWTLNGERLNGELEFQPASIDEPTPRLFSTVNGDTFEIKGAIFHSANPTPGLSNPLNQGSDTQTASGLEANVSGLTATFEDIELSSPRADSDFNDTIIQVDLLPVQQLNFGFVPTVTPQFEINDTDSGNLNGATVEIVSGDPADQLAIGESLAGTGIAAVEDGSAGRVVLEGDAPVATYETILRSITLQAGGTLGERVVTVQVVDDEGAASDPAQITFDFSAAGQVVGNDGPNTLSGTDGTDLISGRGGDDMISGRAGADLLDGGEGDDILEGGRGSDLLFGGPGNDTLTGGDGADHFFLLSLPDRGDQILDFNADEGDVLDLSALFQDVNVDIANVESFLQFEQSGANDIAVSADVDGPAAGFDFVQLVTLVDPVGISAAPNAEQQAVNNGAVAV